MKPTDLFLLATVSLVACGAPDETDTSADSDTDADTDSDTDADTDSDTDADTDSDTDADSDTDTDTTCTVKAYGGAPPEAFFALEDAGSTTIVDGAGDHDATSAGTVTSIAGKVGNAATFDGSSSYLTSYSGPFNGQSFSWAGWVRLDALPADFASIANVANGTQANTGWLLVISSTGVPQLFTEAGTSQTEIATNGTTPLALGAWTHLALTFGDGNVALYVNGASVAAQNVGYTTVQMGTNPYTLGRDANNGARYLTGALDEIGYWNLTLSAEDVAAIYADGECGLSSF